MTGPLDDLTPADRAELDADLAAEVVEMYKDVDDPAVEREEHGGLTLHLELVRLFTAADLSGILSLDVATVGEVKDAVRDLIMSRLDEVLDHKPTRET